MAWCAYGCAHSYTHGYTLRNTRSIDEAQSRCVSRCEYLQDGKWKGSLGLIQLGLAWVLWLGQRNFSGAGNASSAAAMKFPAQKLCQVKRTAAWRVEGIEEV